MKTSLTLILVGAACALLNSCGTYTTEVIYVTSEEGEPISGARIVPCTIPKGCHGTIVTDPCGKACLPSGAGTYTVEKDYFRPVRGVQPTGRGQHVVMVPGWPN